MTQQELLEGELTPFSTDLDDELPVSVQLSWRLHALISTGRLAPGERLPSFRQLAGWAGVNVNTVRAVYRSLEEEGLVVSRQGQGTFVAEGVAAAPQLEEIVAEALRRTRAAGLSPRELAIVATACAGIPGVAEEGAEREVLPDPGGQSEAIEVRHELRRQIGRLEAELSAYTRDLPSELPTATLSAEAHIAGVEELERTRDTLIAQLSEAQRAAELRARRAGEARARRDEMLKASERAEPEEAVSPLAKVMGWWRSKP